jgi:alpha-ribazole phosphatase
MRSYAQLKDDPAYQAWIAGDNEANVAPDGESGDMMTRRVLRGLDRLIADGRDTLLVTHGGVIAAIMTRLFPSAGRNRYERQSAPGCGYAIDLSAGRFDPF